MMKSRRVQRVVGVVSLAFALAISIPNRLPAQQTEPTTTNTAVEVQCGQPPAAQNAINKTTDEVEWERRFNELRHDFLESRVKLVDWWLASTAIFLTLFGILIVLVGYLGYRRFQEIEIEARQNVLGSKQHAEEAARLVTEIRTKRDEAESFLKNTTAESADKEANKTSEAAESVKKNPEASPIDRARADAILLQQHGKFEEALQKWHSIANVLEGTDPGIEAQAWFSVGYLSSERGDHKAAMDAYDEVLRLDPKYAAAYNNRGNAKHAVGQHEAAIADHDKAIQLNPSLTDTYYNRGNVNHAVGQHEAAIADYDKAIQLNPNYAAAYNNRGNVKHDMNQYEAAIADYDKAIQLDPNYTNAYYNRAVANFELRRMSEARQDCQKTLVLTREAGDRDIETKAETLLAKLGQG